MTRFDKLIAGGENQGGSHRSIILNKASLLDDITPINGKAKMPLMVCAAQRSRSGPHQTLATYTQVPAPSRHASLVICRTSNRQQS